jgi:hypothetical protein
LAPSVSGVAPDAASDTVPLTYFQLPSFIVAVIAPLRA